MALALLIERLLREDSIMRRPGAWIAGLLPLLPLALLGGAGIIVLLLGFAAFEAGRMFPGIVTMWRSSVTTWIGRALLAIVGAISLIGLVADAVEIL